RVPDRVVLQVPDVRLSARVRQHLEHVRLGLVRDVIRDDPGALVLPDLLPLGLDRLRVVAVHGGQEYPRDWRRLAAVTARETLAPKRLARLRDVRVARANHHGAVPREVADGDGAVRDPCERAVAAVDRQPAGAAHGGVAVAAVAAEAAAVVAAPELAHPLGLRGRGRGGAAGAPTMVPGQPRAAPEASTAQVHVD